MRALALIIWVLLAGGAAAETARVRGGEHRGFTRIVIEAGALSDWRFGRTPDGYEFQADEAVTGFDLSQAFDKIPRSRVSALWRDPDSGRLRLKMPCTCHAIAFEVRPGAVAIDVTPGPAPEGSSFELALDEPPAPTKAVTPQPAYDWLAIRREKPEVPALPVIVAPEATTDPLLDALVRQISRGVAEGIIGIDGLHPMPDPALSSLAEKGGVRISNGEMPGMSVATPAVPSPNLTAGGKPCLADPALDLAAWLTDAPITGQIADSRKALLAEFDRPDQDQVLNAVRLHLAAGLGAEARQLLDLLEEEQPILRSLSYLADLDPPAQNAFAGMESCDTAAALWAVVAQVAAGPADPAIAHLFNNAAVSRSFSALPSGLRRHLGPPLVGFYLSLGDETTARRLRDAILRAPGEAGQEVTLMDAGLQLATGDPARAAALAQEVLEDPGGRAAEAAVLTAETAFAGARVVSPALADQLAALAGEFRGTGQEAAILRAEILAAAMSGDFARAFSLLSASPQTAPDLWLLAAGDAPDDLFLTEALNAAVELPQVRPDTAFAIAERLHRAGFAAEALAWLGPVSAGDDPERRLLAAEAALILRDARGVLWLLAGMTDPAARDLMARAALQLGDAAGAAEILAGVGDEAAVQRAEIRAGRWSDLAVAEVPAWSEAAALTLPSAASAPDEGPLAEGTRLVSEAGAARAAIGSLLAAVESPAP
ncbi:hypothetical protein [Pseudogemmobacter humi]|uniref:Uncharacterized protein n=1 Tax=Pseudogemmobacter humi TaxID=2483812 RepID=A0A3P5WZH7_9RHOB|nr:hypothetical protein [Pseudogemmobacter humi]VDC20314.1 hypothetical protein XINFAN_00427 [Pseudogemmobacter humi]